MRPWRDHMNKDAHAYPFSPARSPGVSSLPSQGHGAGVLRRGESSHSNETTSVWTRRAGTHTLDIPPCILTGYAGYGVQGARAVQGAAQVTCRSLGSSPWGGNRPHIPSAPTQPRPEAARSRLHVHTHRPPPPHTTTLRIQYDCRG